MPRRPRRDCPGMLHHVMNRGLARRTVFETRKDVRAFLALFARAVHDGRVELHAFAILSTHFHVLLRSLDGRLSETLRRVENAYVRRFNRTRRRDGPLFRGRFRSFPVETTRYLHTLVRYIDQNPVNARLAPRAEDYPYGSARSLVADGARPRWLARDVVDAFLASQLEAGRSRAEAYRSTFAPRLTPALLRFVESRLAHASREPDPLDDLVAAADESVHAWMLRRAHLADHTKPGLPLADGTQLLVEVARQRAADPRASVTTGPRRRRCVWDLAEVALLHDVAGETFSVIARRHGTHASHPYRLYEEHRALMDSTPSYARTVAALACRAIDRPFVESGWSPRQARDLAPRIFRRTTAAG